MSFAPPPGPPPPPVPPGWKAQYDERYKQWFFVNLKTGASQWTPPDEDVGASSTPPGDAPPSYQESGPGNAAAVAAAKDDKSRFGSNNPYGSKPRDTTVDDDAKLAAQLQAEENARAASASQRSRPVSRGANADYYSSQPSGPSPPPQDNYSASNNTYPDEQLHSGSRGFLGKLLGRSNRPSGQPQQGYGYPQGQYPQGQQYPPQGGYGYGPPQSQYGYPPQGGYRPGYGPDYGYAPAPQQQPGRSGGGLGTLGGAALGVGGGLLAGALITDMVEDHDQNEYDQGYQQGFDNGADDYGGGGDF